MAPQDERDLLGREGRGHASLVHGRRWEACRCDLAYSVEIGDGSNACTAQQRNVSTDGRSNTALWTRTGGVPGLHSRRVCSPALDRIVAAREFRNRTLHTCAHWGWVGVGGSCEKRGSAAHVGSKLACKGENGCLSRQIVWS